MKNIKPRGNVSVCPECGYKDGFHVSFDFESDSGRGKIVLICPSCHQRFGIGWEISVRKTS
jgi:hypothetical protein